MTTPPSLPTLPGLSWSRHKKPGFSTRVASHVSGREVRVALMEYPRYEFEAVYSGLASTTIPAFAGLGSSSLQSLMGFFLQLQGQFGTFLYTDPDDNSVTGQAFGTGVGSVSSFTMMRSLGGFLEPAGWVTTINNVYLNGAVIPGGGLSAPATPSLSQSAGGSLAAATDYVKITYVTASGETTPSSEASLAVSANYLLDVASPSAPSPASATGWNIYAASTSGAEVLQNSSPIAIGTNWTEPASGLVTGTASPPSSNTTGWSLSTPNTLDFAGNVGSGVVVSADFSYAFNCRFLDDQMDFEEFMSNLWKLESMKFRSIKSWLGG
jgi:hypothetical protein